MRFINTLINEKSTAFCPCIKGDAMGLFRKKMDKAYLIPTAAEKRLAVFAMFQEKISSNLCYLLSVCLISDIKPKDLTIKSQTLFVANSPRKRL